jgi:hypothetical protein
MAEGTNEFLREIDELLGDEVTETDEKDVRQLDDAREPYVHSAGARRPETMWSSFFTPEKTS